MKLAVYYNAYCMLSTYVHTYTLYTMLSMYIHILLYNMQLCICLYNISTKDIVQPVSWNLTEIQLQNSLDLGKVLWNGRYDIYIYIIHVFYVSVTYFCITVFIYSWCQENGPFSVHPFYPYFLVHRLHWEPFSGNTRYVPLDCPLTVYTYYLLWLSIVEVVYCCLYLLYVIYSVYIYIYIYIYIVCSVCMYVMLYVNVCNDMYLCSVYVIGLLHISVPNII